MILVRVVAPHFVAGVEYDEASDTVVQAAPILRYAVGWSRSRFRAYVEAKGWTANIIRPALCPLSAPEFAQFPENPAPQGSPD